jgi:hypothetical protein
VKVRKKTKKPKVLLRNTSIKKIVGIIAIAIFLAFIGLYLRWRSYAAVPPPPIGGYFTTMRPVGSFSALPSDSQAAAMVTRSSWEPRPANNTANHTRPPTTFRTLGYSGMENHTQLFSRVTGNFTGTTDEIIQWAAAKWGLRDEVIRAEMVTESNWYQNHKNTQGVPIQNHGYGDYGHCGGSPPPSGYGTSGPASFGISQIKWCAHKDAGAPGYDGWPWSENSTAYNLDYYGAIIRGCYEGWDSWLGNGYRAGDMWGCVGRWYAGEWYSAGANTYINDVKANLSSKPWRSWTDYGVSTAKPGDINNPPNGDGRVDNADLSYLITKWLTSDARADLNDDGIVNLSDFSLLITLYGT